MIFSHVLTIHFRPFHHSLNVGTFAFWDLNYLYTTLTAARLETIMKTGLWSREIFFQPLLDFRFDRQHSTLLLIVNQYLESCHLLHSFSILNYFQGVFAPRSDLEGLKPYSCVARQAVRRLVSLGFNLDNLKNSFRADPNYEIPANVFLQDMTQVKAIIPRGFSSHQKFCFRFSDWGFMLKQTLWENSSKNISVRVIRSFKRRRSWKLIVESGYL